MSDRSVLFIALGIFAAVGLDMVLNGGQAVFFMLLKVTDLVEYLAFWR